MINFQLIYWILISYHLYFKVYLVTIVCIIGCNRSFKLQVKAFIYPWIKTQYHEQCTVEIRTFTEESITPSVGGQWWSERVKSPPNSFCQNGLGCWEWIFMNLGRILIEFCQLLLFAKLFQHIEQVSWTIYKAWRSD